MFWRHIVESITTITVFPLPGGRFDKPHKAVSYFPLVGALLGLLVYGVLVLAMKIPGVWPEFLALVYVLLLSGLTGALHLDGLADTVDGLFGARDRARSLEIMKDKSLGTFGTLAILLILLAKWVFLTRLFISGAPWAVVVALVVSRFGLSYLCGVYPYARKEGGTGQNFIDLCGRRELFLSFTLTLFLTGGLAGAAGLFLLVVGFLAVTLLGWWFSRRLGGVTGDTLGASAEMVETLLLGVAALFGPLFPLDNSFGFLPFLLLFDTGLGLFPLLSFFDAGFELSSPAF